MANKALEIAVKKNQRSRAAAPASADKVTPRKSARITGTISGRLRLRRPLQFSPIKSPLAVAVKAARKRKEQLNWKIVRYSEPANDPKVAIERLPLANEACNFQLPYHWCRRLNKHDPRAPSFVHIKRNVYLVKPKKLKSEDGSDEDSSMQCSCKENVCLSDCICRLVYTSCSSSCACEADCANPPFQKRLGRKLRLAETKACGWGVFADENIKAGDFVIEYVGEVIDDRTCEQRLWALKSCGETNFYLCEVSADMVIDATNKGNISRFINHSCQPNAQIRKWQCDGEIRIGVFAISRIPEGQEVTYDYKFIQYGTEQKCRCESLNCKGVLGSKRRIRKQKQTPNSSIKDGLVSCLSGQKKNKFPQSSGLPKELTCHIGHRVRVWWPLDQKFYSGRIVHYNESLGKHQVLSE